MTSKPIAFITGAAGGIGRAAAEYFHQSGYRLWLCDQKADGLHEMGENYPDAILETVNLAVASELETLCQKVTQSPDQIAVGFVNAGVIAPGEATQINRQTIDFHVDVNLRAAAHIAQALGQHMAAHKSGQIIGTVSTAGMIALPESAAYAASKFGIRGYLLSLAQELRSQGVHVSCIYPNAIDTPMLRYEAYHGGSVLNFLTPPSKTDAVVAALKRAQRGRKLEYFVPRSDYFLAKLATSFPGLMRPLLPMLNKMGEKGRKKFVAKIEQER